MSPLLLLGAERGIETDLLVKAGGAAGVIAAVALLLVLPLFLEQRREIKRLLRWQQREPERGEQEGDRVLPVVLTAAGTAPPAPGSTAPPLTPAERVTADRPALERLTAERPAVEPPSFWQGILANLRRHRLLLAGLVALLAAVVAAAVILAPSLTDGDGERSALDRSGVELVVLNASSQTALADKVADSLAIAGFDNVRTGTTGTSRRTVVLYEPGNQRAAQQLGRELEVTRVVELDRETRAAAPTDAEVVVVAGEDYARR